MAARGRVLQGDTECLGAEAGDSDGQEDDQHRGVLGPGLDADAVGPEPAGAVAPQHRPRHAHQIEHAGDVAHRGVGPVHVAVQELHPLGNLVVDLQHRGHGHEDQEREVDQGVHDAGRWLAQQGLHVDPGSEVAESTLGVGRLGGTVVGDTPLPVLDAVREQDGPVDDEQRDDRVEGQLQWPRDVGEDLAGDRRIVVEPVDQ